jgi:ACR3 family arsenite efflux pump ArsB
LAVSLFGIAFSEVLATVVGPLIEVWALAVLWYKRHWFPNVPEEPLDLPDWA